MSVNAQNWYWTAVDGRVYSSAQNQLIAPSDIGYQQFLQSTGGVPNAVANRCRWQSEHSRAASLTTIQCHAAVLTKRNFIIMKDNSIPIRDLQKADFTVGDLRALVTVLEYAVAHLAAE